MASAAILLWVSRALEATLERFVTRLCNAVAALCRSEALDRDSLAVLRASVTVSSSCSRRRASSLVVGSCEGHTPGVARLAARLPPSPTALRAQHWLVEILSDLGSNLSLELPGVEVLAKHLLPVCIGGLAIDAGRSRGLHKAATATTATCELEALGTDYALRVVHIRASNGVQQLPSSPSECKCLPANAMSAFKLSTVETNTQPAPSVSP